MHKRAQLIRHCGLWGNVWAYEHEAWPIAAALHYTTGFDHYLMHHLLWCGVHSPVLYSHLDTIDFWHRYTHSPLSRQHTLAWREVKPHLMAEMKATTIALNSVPPPHIDGALNPNHINEASCQNLLNPPTLSP